MSVNHKVKDIEDLTKRAYGQSRGDEKKQLSLMKVTDMDMIFAKPEGFFDSFKQIGDEKDLWTSLR
jgi:hypothetical protein